ncbi:uncharacterized protein YgiB involved in biofilm formation [Methylopila capsulata]|uniref:Uncharacterized protein YgiB involved in biofilm formation n=1 Tax=Methylopila capsulata TaxID=61654 RepID=A0A9W6IUN8_9HYPH|nr:DUF1190 domain-containing protein [Methylopila capsulata]MBM7850649.1 uncharacterized protein YgiB involved in biofilm formation [Methylopila capsulata]GLK55942.1 hypothetical protein GCM10008170_19610 [Methylopila capsulata]
MKRSNGIALGLMGAGAVALSVYRGPSEVVGGVFTDAAQCTRAGIPAEDCDSAQRTASIAHRARAPRYANRATCETEADTVCEASPAGTSAGAGGETYSPAMGGFTLSKDCDYYSVGCAASESGTSGGGGGFATGMRTFRNTGQPVYESRRWRGSYRPVWAFVEPGASGERGRASLKTETISRGGFGPAFGGFRAGS